MVYTVQSTASFTTMFAELYGVYLVYSSMWAGVEPCSTMVRVPDSAASYRVLAERPCQ